MMNKRHTRNGVCSLGVIAGGVQSTDHDQSALHCADKVTSLTTVHHHAGLMPAACWESGWKLKVQTGVVCSIPGMAIEPYQHNTTPKEQNLHVIL